MKLPYYRYILLALLFVGICSFYVYLGVDAVKNHVPTGGLNEENLNVTYETIYTARGEIYDRNGVPLVKNKYTRSLVLEYGAIPETKREINDLFLYASYIRSLYGSAENIPETLSPFAGMYPNIAYDPDKIGNDIIDTNLKYVRRIYGIEESDSKNVVKKLINYYGLLAEDAEGNRVYSDDEVTLLLNLRYDCDAKKFGPDEPYVFCEDINEDMILEVNQKKIQGLNIALECERTYPNDGLATHLIGRLGKISPEDWDYYKEQGYRIDALVGVSGCEEAFESHLRGINGKRKVVRDENGVLLYTEIVEEPKKGNDVYLTIDAKIQQVAQDALKEAVEFIKKDATPTSDTPDGADCSAASTVVMDPETFDILAIASYPSYTMKEYEEKYDELAKDPASPLVFRAVDGLYAPGSTFKVGMSVAALENGTITPNTQIDTTHGEHIKYGKYTYYTGYQPTCWIRNMYGGSHGIENVQAAIKNSCNCFFFEVGRLMGINKMNEYCTKFGFGQATGIEIGEKTGILAGPAYREDNNLLPWSGGDTIAAAIGQSDNVFTPLQLCSYISMIMNGGNRYNAHLLGGVKAYGSDEIIASPEKNLLSSVSISESTMKTIKAGMLEVRTTSASVRKNFKNYPENIQPILKTGTAEVGGKKKHNATMIGYCTDTDNPDKGGITVSVVIEQGMSGANCGIVVNKIMKQFFGLNEVEE